jgi:glycosyltransferase involved in cell wall biosynthesis
METPLPLVSAIIAVRNGERFLAQAIESVLRQSYQPIELIVVDGQSVDHTALIARSYPQVRYLFQQTQGIANAYNEGIAAAHGEYIAFLSHDDYWGEHKLAQQIGRMEQDPAIKYTVTRGKFFVEPGCSYPPGLPQERVQGEPVMYVMETLVARRTLFRQVGLFNPQFSTAEDVDWFARANDLGVTKGVIEEVLLYKRLHDQNLSAYAQDNIHNLLVALHRSIQRKQTGGQP